MSQNESAQQPLPPVSCSPARQLLYIAEGKTEHIWQHVIETPDAAEALEHILKCWLVMGCREISLKRKWRVQENDQAETSATRDVQQPNTL